MTLQELASSAYDRFELRDRANGATFVTLADNAPEWLTMLVRDAHGDMMPDDWRWSAIRSAVGFIAESDESDDVNDLAHEWADGNVDVYTVNRIAWLGSNLARVGYCDEAVEELGVSDSDGITDRIGLGQYMESLEVFGSVATSLERQLDALGVLAADED